MCGHQVCVASAYFINGFEHGSSNPLLEFELYNTDHLMLNLRHGGTTWMSSDLFHELQTWLVITEWSLRLLILAHSTITPFFSTGSENRVAKPLIVPQTGFLLHSVKPLYAAALCVCVCPKLWSDVEMWRAKWIRNLSSAVPVTYGPAHDRQGTACFICGQRGLFTFLFQLFFPSCQLFPVVLHPSFLLESHPGSHSAPHQLFFLLQCRGLLTVCSEFEQRGFAGFYLLPVWFTFVGHIQ